MKALSLTQPWATFLALGYKNWETRGWRTQYVGPFLIHATKAAVDMSLDLGPYELIEDGGPSILAPDGSVHPLPRGAIVGATMLTGCYDIVGEDYWPDVDAPPVVARFGRKLSLLDSTGLTDISTEIPLGDWTPGRIGIRCEHTRALSKAIPTPGKRMLWTPDTNLVTMCAALAEKAT